jgi:diguanylate cyclase (GGDEF)-like protein/PAS domain S-box-containing protein
MRGVQELRALLPRGGTMSEADFAKRHHMVLVVLWAHVAGVFTFGLIRGFAAPHLLAELAGVVALASAASAQHLLSTRVRAVLAAMGLLTCSALLVHLSGGMIEMHFHFFVMVALIALYQDWLPFVWTIAFVALHHAVIGLTTPRNVFNHPAAWSTPWKWALIHALFVLAASAAQLVSWRVVEEEHERSQVSLRASERRFRTLIEKSSDAVMVAALDGTVIYESNTVERVLGFRAGARVGENGFAFVHPDDLPMTHAVFDAVREAPGNAEAVELRGLHADGTWRWLEVHLRNLSAEPDVGGIVANYRDITERHVLEGKLAHQAFHDALTGLPNRSLFLDRVGHALENRDRNGGRTVAVLFIDLDDFKTVNDALGHGAGDALLGEIADRLRDCTSPGDTCARFGGDEFGVLLEGIEGRADAERVAARILRAAQVPMVVEGNPVTIGASIGIAVGDDDTSADHLIRNADLAMYRAKHSGKARHEVFQHDMHEAVIERLALETELRRATGRGELVNHYQPIVDMRTGRVVGAEALIRWLHPERGLLSPAVFVPVAEETGLITDIGRAVLEQACQDATTWSAAGGAPYVSVNLSTRQLQDIEVVDLVAEALATSGLDPARLTLEITESVLIDNPSAAAATLGQLKALGVSVALDDFGTGYSSLSYLARFPVDILKIDKTFVDALGDGAPGNEVALVTAIIEMSRALDLRIIAEGVESASQADHLCRLGCEIAQGFHFARPMAQADLLARLDGGPARPGARGSGPSAPAPADGHRLVPL